MYRYLSTSKDLQNGAKETDLFSAYSVKFYNIHLIPKQHLKYKYSNRKKKIYPYLQVMTSWYTQDKYIYWYIYFTNRYCKKNWSKISNLILKAEINFHPTENEIKANQTTMINYCFYHQSFEIKVRQVFFIKTKRTNNPKHTIGNKHKWD